MTIKYSKLNNQKLSQIIKCFALDLTATQTCHLININRNTANRYYYLFRKAIYGYQLNKLNRALAYQTVIEKKKEAEENFEIPENPAFGIFILEGELYTELLGNASEILNHRQFLKKSFPQEIIGIILAEGERYLKIRYPQDEKIPETKSRTFSQSTDANAIKKISESHPPISVTKPQCIQQDKFAAGQAEAFWSFIKKRLNHLNGAKPYFYLHLKECEWRWKKNPMELEKELWHILSDYSLISNPAAPQATFIQNGVGQAKENVFL
jgi:transposase-like protein